MKDQILNLLERAIESRTGEKPDDLRRQTLSERRAEIEQRHKAPMRIVSEWPFIGRGNVLKDRVLNGDQVNKLLDEALK